MKQRLLRQAVLKVLPVKRLQLIIPARKLQRVRLRTLRLLPPSHQEKKHLQESQPLPPMKRALRVRWLSLSQKESKSLRAKQRLPSHLVDTPLPPVNLAKRKQKVTQILPGNPPQEKVLATLCRPESLAEKTPKVPRHSRKERVPNTPRPAESLAEKSLLVIPHQLESIAERSPRVTPPLPKSTAERNAKVIPLLSKSLAARGP